MVFGLFLLIMLLHSVSRIVASDGELTVLQNCNLFLSSIILFSQDPSTKKLSNSKAVTIAGFSLGLPRFLVVPLLFSQ